MDTSAPIPLLPPGMNPAGFEGALKRIRVRLLLQLFSFHTLVCKASNSASVNRFLIILLVWFSVVIAVAIASPLVMIQYFKNIPIYAWLIPMMVVQMVLWFGIVYYIRRKNQRKIDDTRAQVTIENSSTFAPNGFFAQVENYTLKFYRCVPQGL
jgi:hypothetical protein